MNTRGTQGAVNKVRWQALSGPTFYNTRQHFPSKAIFQQCGSPESSHLETMRKTLEGIRGRDLFPVSSEQPRRTSPNFPTMSMPTTATSTAMSPARKSGQSRTPDHLLQFGGYIISNAGVARWGSRLTNPPHTFPSSASIVASHEVHKKLKELNLAGLLNVGTLQNPRFIVFTKNKVHQYREGVHERDLPPLEADKWDKWTLKVIIQELRTLLWSIEQQTSVELTSRVMMPSVLDVDPSEITAFKSVLSNDMPHDPDMFGEVSRQEMEAWWKEK